mgnify:CR=1 FL=1
MTLTGKLFRDAVISGANNIANNRAAVDELNVFPVPDGDTGTNMSMTIGNALPELKAAGDGISAGDAAKLTASAMLRGARGNSGVILSLIFRGLSKGLAGQAEADAKMLSDAFKLGVDAAYKSVMKPTEGTILTVVREAWENTKDLAQEGGDAAEFLAKFIEEGEKSLANTPELLPALKKAGVVDAGGKGLLVILSGMQQVISGGQAHREVLQRIGGIALQIGHDHVGLGLIHAEADLLLLGVQRVFRYVVRSILGVEGQAIDAVIGKVLGQHGVDVLIPLTIAAPHLDAVVRTLLQDDGLIVLEERDADVLEGIGVGLRHHHILRRLDVGAVELLRGGAEGIGGAEAVGGEPTVLRKMRVQGAIVLLFFCYAEVFSHPLHRPCGADAAH